MMDLLVKLYDLPPAEPAIEKITEFGARLHRPFGPEKAAVVDWVTEKFGARWGSEADMAFAGGNPVSAFTALDPGDAIIGFACYNTTFKGFFGPTGVDDGWRGKGIGTALLLRSLHALREDGHAYGIIGFSALDEFYESIVGAIPIPDSDPGAYGGRIKIT
ncbi:MAG: GNAT family N-acetyltransferase [Verrucomicrobiales bacterium]|nr:GNAT family N-acetyltransferase [Verrucomicrobiales bacterium]